MPDARTIIKIHLNYGEINVVEVRADGENREQTKERDKKYPRTAMSMGDDNARTLVL